MRKLATWLLVLGTTALVAVGWRDSALWLEGLCEHGWALPVMMRLVAFILTALQLGGVQ
ncbi:MAG: hypothetical protein ACRD4U_04040 [Candidatus Acidiferrales bacterium]